jgi:hypothetical protein
VKAKIKEFRILIISVVIALVIVIANMIVSSQVWNKNLNNQSMAIQKLNGDIEKQRVSFLNAADSAKSRVTGLDTKRVKTDDGIIESKVLKKYFTWKSGADYEALKKDFDENFANNDGNFGTIILPDLKSEQDDDGNETNAIDNGEFGVLNMTYVDKQSHVTSIEDDVYSYFTEVTVQSTIKGADKEASTGHIVVTYSIDKAGNISHLNGFTIAD